MVHILRLLHELGWNKRAMNEGDFYKLCRRERIKVIEKPMEIPGIYAVIDEEKFIFINSELPRLKKLHVMFHELSHHFLHGPTVAFFHMEGSNGRPSKDDMEADAMAAIALIPLKDFAQLRLFDDHSNDWFATDLFWARWVLYQTYGI